MNHNGLSRNTKTQIDHNEWVLDIVHNERFYKLIVGTEHTRNRRFVILGSDELNLEANQDSDWAQRFNLGNTIAIGALHCVPILDDWIATIIPGTHIHFGSLNDGLTDLCGALGFVRLVNLSSAGYQPEAIATIHLEKAQVLLRQAGLGVIKAYLSGYYSVTRPVHSIGISLKDPAVKELRCSQF